MDPVELATLESEVRDDLRVMRETLATARDRFEQPPPAGLEASAHYLHRFYNAFEQLGLRLAKAFENRIDDDAGWHSSVLHRLTLEIPGVRPAFLPSELKPALNELRGFRHVMVHAYELVLDGDRIASLLEDAALVAGGLPRACEDFFARVRGELGV